MGRVEKKQPTSASDSCDLFENETGILATRVHISCLAVILPSNNLTKYLYKYLGAGKLVTNYRPMKDAGVSFVATSAYLPR